MDAMNLKKASQSQHSVVVQQKGRKDDKTLRRKLGNWISLAESWLN